MEPHDLLPKRVANYIQDIGVRSLDHLADRFEAPVPAAAPEGEPATVPANAIQALVQHWKTMAAGDKEQFVERVAASVMEMIVASATLPLGLKVGKKTVKVAKKVIRKRVKRVRKAAAGFAPDLAETKDSDGKRKKKK
ncbi:MAG: hypothetical protein M3P29_05275 [Acidobacteriota bacterium]|nr:hypothetical protein [Acidobacteriota bacterium]